ncbi:MAG: Cytochrome c' [Rhodospirillaceae bacterium]|nr:MAG: Cytochrome c' [Rhodospirillaceae bacterium]
MKKAITAFIFCLIVAVPGTGRAESKEESAYLRLVMDIFSNHIEAIELLTAKPGKYADNVVRHTNALANTAGLLDHAFPGDKNTSEKAVWPWRSEAEFNKRAHALQTATKELATTAQAWLDAHKQDPEHARRGHDRTAFMAALEHLKETCRACHGSARHWP